MLTGPGVYVHWYRSVGSLRSQCKLIATMVHDIFAKIDCFVQSIEHFYPKSVQWTEHFCLKSVQCVERIASLEDAFIAADDIEYAAGNKIPLWAFGFLY